MSFMKSMDIVGSALTAERFRMDTILQNIANSNTTRTPEGEPYRRKQVVFQERAIDFQSALADASNRIERGGVRVTEVVESQRDFTPVMYPNVNLTEERVDLMAASNAYDANLTALAVVKSLALKALEIGKA